MTDVGVVVGQLLRLLGDRLGDLFAAVADVHAVEAGEGVEQAGAVAVADVDTLAAGNDARTPLAARKLREVGRGMEEAVPVPGFQLIVLKHHFSFPLRTSRDRRRSEEQTSELQSL